jgi:transposase
MEHPRYTETGKGSFFGDYVYDQMIPTDHFLRKLNEVVDWKNFTRKLTGLHKGEGVVGRPPFDPEMLLKMELLAYLYNLSERQVENYLN